MKQTIFSNIMFLMLSGVVFASAPAPAMDNTTVVAPKVYYFAANGNDNNSGLSPDVPLKSSGKFNMLASSTLNPGDSVLFKAGDTFNVAGSANYMTITRSGNMDAPITISSYGDGPRPVLSGMDTIPKSGFVSEGSNIWTLTGARQSSRWWKDGLEQVAANTKESLSPSLTWYRSGTTLSVYSTSNPDGHWTTYGAPNGLRLMNCSYVHVRGLEIRDVEYYAVPLRNANHCVIAHNKIANYGNSAVQLTINQGTTDTTQITSFNEIAYNDFNSEFMWAYEKNMNHSKTGAIEGIDIGCAAQDNWVHHNTMEWNYHAGVGGYISNSACKPTARNIIEYNTIDGKNSWYARGAGMGGGINLNQYNIFRFNIIKNCTVRSQINGDHNYWYGNIWMSGGLSKVYPDRSQHVQFQEWSTPSTVSRYNIFAFNVLDGAYDVGLISYSPTIEGNEVRNNIFINNAYGKGSNAQVQIGHSSPDIGATVWTNNIFYSDSTRNVINYHGNIMELGVAQSLYSTEFSNNINADPHLNTDYSLKADSPARGAGVPVDSIIMDANGVEMHNPPDVGAYQYEQTKNATFIKRHVPPNIRKRLNKHLPAANR